ncbi:ricin B lectin domain-containing protein [Mycena sanguinolenta]|nr:ricin B lectin domain-containing protein [Mycena sanguinolenta]
MFSSALFLALAGFSASAVAQSSIKSFNPAFSKAGIEGCIAVENNADGEPVVIHNCNTENAVHQQWLVSFYTRQDGYPGPIKIFGDKCIDVTGGVNADGTKLQIWTCGEGNPSQQWVSVKDNTFQWVGTDKCIDLTGGSISDGNVLQIWTCDSNNDNQGWTSGPGPVTNQPITLFASTFSATQQYCLGAASNTDGAEIALVSCTNPNDYKATFPNGNITWNVPVVTGPIKTFGNKCLDVPNGSTANGVKLQLWTCADGNTNQNFQYWYGSLEQIEWNGTGKCIDLTSGNFTVGNPIQLWDCDTENTNPNQWWFEGWN